MEYEVIKIEAPTELDAKLDDVKRMSVALGSEREIVLQLLCGYMSISHEFVVSFPKYCQLSPKLKKNIEVECYRQYMLGAHALAR